MKKTTKKSSTRSKHPVRCACASCKDPIESEIWEAKQLSEYGFYIHVVPEHDPQSPSGFNAHTHGIDLIGHPDFQITLPLKSFDHVAAFFHEMCSRVKKGQSFSHGDIIHDLIANDYVVRLIDATECDRPVLRIIFADKDNNVMPHDMSHNEAIAQYGYSKAEL
jgi:hypothetical protein